jgi:hypothetical protein
MMMLLNRNLVFLYLVFALSLGYLITAINLGNPLSDGRVEPSFFPILLGLFSVTFSAILVFREFALLSIVGHVVDLYLHHGVSGSGVFSIFIPVRFINYRNLLIPR